MAQNSNHFVCEEGEALVLVEVVPLCRIAASNEKSRRTCGSSLQEQQERCQHSDAFSLRGACVMSCDRALCLLKGVSNVVFK